MFDVISQQTTVFCIWVDGSKKIILKLSDEEFSYAKIADIKGVSKSCISGFVKRYKTICNALCKCVMNDRDVIYSVIACANFWPHTTHCNSTEGSTAPPTLHANTYCNTTLALTLNLILTDNLIACEILDFQTNGPSDK